MITRGQGLFNRGRHLCASALINSLALPGVDQIAFAPCSRWPCRPLALYSSQQRPGSPGDPLLPIPPHGETGVDSRPSGAALSVELPPPPFPGSMAPRPVRQPLSRLDNHSVPFGYLVKGHQRGKMALSAVACLLHEASATTSSGWPSPRCRQSWPAARTVVGNMDLAVFLRLFNISHAHSPILSRPASTQRKSSRRLLPPTHTRPTRPVSLYPRWPLYSA